MNRGVKLARRKLIKTESERQLHNSMNRLAKDVAQLKEKCKVLDIKISRISDESAKLAVQEQGIVKALDMMVETVIKIADKKDIPREKEPGKSTSEVGIG